MRAHHGAVEHHPLEIAVGGELVHQPLPDAFLLPAGEPLVDAVPRAELGRKHPPRRPGAGHPEHRLDEQAGRRLLFDVEAGMLLETRPHAPPRLVRQPSVRHLRSSPPQPISEAYQRYLILNVNRT
mgnify:CR=1 FL=1